MLELGWDVTIAGEGPSLSILIKEFPNLPTLTLEGYRINYPKMTKIVKLAYLSAWRFATEAIPPAFVPDPAGR
jgi:hypothetical protein